MAFQGRVGGEGGIIVESREWVGGELGGRVLVDPGFSCWGEAVFLVAAGGFVRDCHFDEPGLEGGVEIGFAEPPPIFQAEFGADLFIASLPGRR
jgi:hypothetical protein